MFSPHHALVWQAVAVDLSLAAGSRGGGRQVANTRMAFCRSFMVRCSPHSAARPELGGSDGQPMVHAQVREATGAEARAQARVQAHNDATCAQGRGRGGGDGSCERGRRSGGSTNDGGSLVAVGGGKHGRKNFLIVDRRISMSWFRQAPGNKILRTNTRKKCEKHNCRF